MFTNNIKKLFVKLIWLKLELKRIIFQINKINQLKIKKFIAFVNFLCSLFYSAIVHLSYKNNFAILAYYICFNYCFCENTIDN